MIYIAGPKLDTAFVPANADLSPFVLAEVDSTRVEMLGAVQDFSWLGSHQILIKSTNGVLDTAADARGVDGLYRSVLSDPILIMIINPCLTSVVNGDEGIVIENLSVKINKSVLNVNYTGPTDSASVTYGNGYDKCGNLTYSWLNLTSLPFENENFSYNSTVIDREADTFWQNLTSFPTGTTLYDYFTLKMELVDYPTSMPAIFPVMLTYRECFPYDFKGPKINDLEMLVGDDGPKIDFFMNQEPCTWN